MQERSGEVMFCTKKVRHQLEKGAISMGEEGILGRWEKKKAESFKKNLTSKHKRYVYFFMHCESAN